MHILLIEDDTGIIAPLTLYLEKASHIVTVCQNGGKAMEIFREVKPELIILDINLPEKTGFEICQEVRSISKVPIIVLSARASEDDKVELLEMGADDYVSKPFSPRELVARISAVSKRLSEKKDISKSKTITLGGLTIDTKNFMVFGGNNEEIKCTKTEFSIIEYLVKNARSVIKRDVLMRDIMGYDNYIYDRTIDTHMKNIRKKLEGLIEIETVRGIGYKIHACEDMQKNANSFENQS